MNNQFLRTRMPIRTITAAMGAVLAVLLMSSPATAALRYWNSRDNPLIASDDGTDKAAGYGIWKIGVTRSHEFYASTGVNPAADFARARMQVSESNWGPDTHSGSTYTKGDPY